MFLQNKYSKWYNSIIDAAKSRNTIIGYSERHHIIPKSLGGLDDKDNIIKLTAREHFVCHLLLTKMVSGSGKHKMICAAKRMLTHSSNHHRYLPPSRLYQYLKEQFSIQQSILSSSMPRTSESNAKRSATQKGCKSYPRTAETIAKQKETKRLHPQVPWNKGKTTPQKGMTYEEIYGVTRAKELRELRSSSLSGKAKSATTKAIWSKNRKGKTNGGLNTNATPVTINNITYACKNDACSALNISLYKLNKMLFPSYS